MLIQRKLVLDSEYHPRHGDCKNNSRLFDGFVVV